MIRGKNILVGVTGSIAVYKACELVREFVKAGAQVRVVMSESAKRFVTPLTFEAITKNSVLHEGSESWVGELNHIDIGKWADLFVIAPATINTINKLNHGVCDNLLLEVAHAYSKTILLAPAANTTMYKQNATQASLKLLKLQNYKIVEPASKLLACGDEGEGALADVSDIFHMSVRELLKEEFWINRKVIVSGGGSVEKIDQVRFISNFSSGKMASNLALSLYYKGADVCLVSSKFPISLAKDIYILDVQNGEDMAEYLTDCIRIAKKGVLTKATLMDDSVPEVVMKKPYLFMAAAISDYKPKYPQDGKLKKDMLGDKWSLELVQSDDILSSLDKSDIVSIGFKAEMDEVNGYDSAKSMLESKNLDGVCLNYVSKNNFGSDENEITLITKSGDEFSLEKSDKLTISLEILERVKGLE